MHKAFKACTAVLLALVMTVSLVNGAAVVRNDDDTISYEPPWSRVFTPRAATPLTRSPTPRWVPERWTVS